LDGGCKPAVLFFLGRPDRVERAHAGAAAACRTAPGLTECGCAAARCPPHRGAGRDSWPSGTEDAARWWPATAP